MEAIMIPKLMLYMQTLIIPKEWKYIDSEWADQDTLGVTAQILLGADQATLFSHAVTDQTGFLLLVNQARLMKSEITGKYIMFGSCGNNRIYSRNMSKWDKINQPNGKEPHLPVIQQSYPK